MHNIPHLNPTAIQLQDLDKLYNVSVLHQNKGGIGKSIPDDKDISRDLIGKSFPVDREGLTVLNPILPCK